MRRLMTRREAAGRTPVFMAALALLLAAGCEVRRPAPAPTARPALSLHDAVRADDRQALALHRVAGTDVNARDLDGATALHLAAFHGLHEVVDLLVAWNADVNAVDALGRAPVHLAVLGNHPAVIRRLIAADADLNRYDGNGQTAIELARQLERPKLYDLLLAAGAELDFAPAVEEELAEVETPAPAPAPAARRIQGNFRTWNSAGGASIEAEFVELVLDTVVLRTPEDQIFRIQINRLRRDEQIQARQLSATAAPRIAPRERATATAPGRASISSTALRIGKEGGWTVLEDCRLRGTSANDGDSFHVQHKGKDYIFRLYYVDAAETSMSFPQRVQDQAKYFRTDTQQTLKLGDLAARFTNKQLAGKPFTVVTRWEDARGRSSLPRHYAFVNTEAGDLDELLTAEGLARIYGMPIDSSLGQTKRSALQRLENKAKQANLGAWAKSKSVAVAEKP